VGHLDDLVGICDAFEAQMPSPAGASAAGAVAAIAASVVAMAGDGSPGWEAAGDVAGRARAARRRLLALAEEDVEAFHEVMVAGRGNGDVELPAALVGATLVPLEIGELSLEVAGLAEAAVRDAKRPIRADATAAATLAASAAQVALVVVEVNLGHPAFPGGQAEDIRQRVDIVRRGLGSLSSA